MNAEVRKNSSQSTTVVVVGAGMSGLIAARELHRRGIDVMVVEAADRHGGRALSQTTACGSRVDLGGQWIGHDHYRFSALAAELGTQQFQMHTGLIPTVLDRNKKVTVLGPSMLITGLAIAAIGVLSLKSQTQRWNSTTIDSWLRKVPGRIPKRILEVIAGVSWTVGPEQLSVHTMVKMIQNQGGLRTMLSTKGGAQDSLIVEGVGTLTDRLAAELGSRVRLGHRVTSISQADGHVAVETTEGTIRAAKVIVTVPPPHIAHIRFKPPLPEARAAVAQNTFMGTVYKAIAVYERPFWREYSSGEFIILDSPGRGVFDSSPPGGPGHLCFLVGGPEARLLDGLDESDRRAAILSALVPHLGDEVLKPASWHDKSWHLDEYIGGGYLALFKPGSADGFLPVPSDKVGNIHWAGTESANDHAGYFEGAIESGCRAAREVVDALRSSNEIT